MRTHDSLERLAAVAPKTGPLPDAGKEDRILAGILATPRDVPRRSLVRPALVLVALAAIGAVIAVISTGGTVKNVRHDSHIALTGARLSLAGYHFRTPAGFQDSSIPCEPGATDAYSAAASADGGCVSAYFMLSTGKYAIAPDAQSVDVGGRQGYVVLNAATTTTATSATTVYLYVAMPPQGDYRPYLMLIGKGLSADQLEAIAESGLPNPS
jgi:hypothetical protein